MYFFMFFNLECPISVKLLSSLGLGLTEMLKKKIDFRKQKIIIRNGGEEKKIY